MNHVSTVSVVGVSRGCVYLGGMADDMRRRGGE